jgi:type I restriction enzyme S subunit
MEHLAQGAIQKNISSTRLLTYLVPLPQPEEQKEIVQVVQTIDRKISLHERKRAALSDLFQTLLHQLMTAQVRVDNLDIDTTELAA